MSILFAGLERETFLRHAAGSNAERTRAHNRQVVLGQVHGAGQAGRAAIARATGLSTQTVSNIIADLMGEGMLVEAGRRVSGRGQPAVQYALAPGGGHALGVEVQPGGVAVALVDLCGRARFVRAAPLGAPTPEAVAAKVVALRDEALEATGAARDRLLGAGVVLPGPFGATGLSGADYAFLPGWAGIEPRHWFTAALDLPVTVENDANAAALAERVSGGAAGLRSYGCLYFGSGIGLGIVSNGQLYRGAFGNAGEIGQMPVATGGGGVVALESVLGARAIAAAAGGDLAALAAGRDPGLMAWVKAARGPLAAAVGLVENLFDPETVFVGGVLPDALLDLLVEGLALPAATVANRPDRTLPRVRRGTSGRFTAARGAAALVLNDILTPRLSAPA